ncbi:18S rRNA maturation protein [Ascosphaera pollenicola]|nr:18S rRNA maturation protein [Ascosphaera pollenicola]
MSGEGAKRKRDDRGEKSEHRKYSKRRETTSDGPALPAPRAVKDKIRDIKRLLDRSEHLPANVRVDKERELQQYESDLAEIVARKKRSVMISKYHFVRFLERKTAMKVLNRLKKARDALKTAEGEDAPALKELDEKIRIAQIDYNYTIYSPLTEKYLSLYPKSNESKDDSPESKEQKRTKEEKVLSVTEKPPLWHVVEQCMADDKLEELREGKLDIGSDGKKNEEKPTKPQQTSTKTKKQKGPQEEKKKDTTDKKQKRESGEERKAAPQKDGKRENRKMRREKERDMKNLHDKLEEVAVRDDQDDDSEGGFFEE